MNRYCVLITTYNGSKTIGETITKLIVAIQHLSRDIEVYVYDDESSDETIRIIQESWSLDAKFLHIIKNNKNLGLFQNKNLGLKNLSKLYDWIFLMHQDDYPYDYWLSYHIELIEQRSLNNTFVIWSSYDNYIEDSLTLIKDGDRRNLIFEICSEDVNLYIKKIYTPYCISGSVINSTLIGKIEFFDEKYKHFGDTDFIVRGMLKGYNHIYYAYPLIVRRQSQTQASFKHKLAFQDIKEFSYFYKKFYLFLNFKERILFKYFLLKVVLKRLLKAFSQRESGKLLSLLSELKTLLKLFLF